MAVKRGFCILAAGLGVASSLRKGKQTQENTDCYSMFDGEPLLKFNLGSKAQVGEVMAKLDDLQCTEMSGYHSSELLAICGAAKVDTLKTLYGRNMTVINDDAGDFYRTTSGVAQGLAEGPSIEASDFYSRWRTYETRIAKLENLVSSCGGAATLEQIGSSVEGRPIMAVRFRGAGWTSGSPRVVVDFELHAREWIVGMAGVYAVEQACEKLRAEPDWLANTEVVFAPAMNPDGSIYSETRDRMWRKNRADNNGNRCKGVDLNRNWDPDWSGRESTSSSKCSDVYYGPAAFSEPETQALKGLLDEAPVVIQLDVHSYGNLILTPWSYKVELHEERAKIDVPGNLMKEAMEAVHGESYTYGGSEALYPASGVCPDYITSQGGWGYTLELRPGSRWGGGGFAPPENQILPGSEDCWAGILAAISWSQDPYTTTPAPAPPPTPPGKGCDPATSSGPDSDGDCKCNSGLSCYEGGNSGCTYSYTASRGYTSTRYFLPSCGGCECLR